MIKSKKSCGIIKKREVNGIINEASNKNWILRLVTYFAIFALNFLLALWKRQINESVLQFMT